MDKKLWDAWLELSAQAMRGTEMARKAFDALALAPLAPDDLTKWMGQWYPKGNASSADLAEVVQTWWETLGAVPRKRYEELLGHNQELLQRLQEAETTIAKLRELLVRDAAKKTREQAEVMLDEWQKTTHDALETQAEMARNWSTGLFGSKPAPSK